MLSLKEIRSIVEQRKGQAKEVHNRLLKFQEEISIITKKIDCSEKVRIIIQKIAKETQEELEYHISDIVTMALAAIFDTPYKFKIKFIIKRNKTECELLFENEKGNLIDPLSASGGGVIDIASFALRIALYTLQLPRSRNTISLDEPFRFLSKDLIPRAGVLLETLSKKLNLQFIIITHIKELAEEVDDKKVFKLSIKKGISSITSL